MTVYELIRELSKHDPDKEVHVTGDQFDFGCHVPVNDVSAKPSPWDKWVMLDIELTADVLMLDSMGLREK